MNERYFITGIGTGIGKTIISAILTERLAADYWKPIQSGDLDNSDSQTISRLISNSRSVIHPEQYRLNQPLSPHLSARLDGINIQLNQILLPQTSNTLLVEGAGGLMVPLNDSELIIDLIKALQLKVIVVSQHYLGSINHSLLTLQLLKHSQIPIKGIIFNGERNEESEKYILHYSGINHIGNIPVLNTINKQSIREAGIKLNL